MTAGTWVTLAVTLGIFFLTSAAGLIVYIVRLTARWTRTEEKLSELIEDVKEIVKDKDAAHTLILETIKEDRRATNLRLRWLEEHLWRRLPPESPGNKVA